MRLGSYTGTAEAQDAMTALGIADATARWQHLKYEGIPFTTYLTNNINHTYGWFDRGCFVKIGESADDLDANNDCVENGEVMAHFDVEDGIVVGCCVFYEFCVVLSSEACTVEALY